MVTHKQCRGPCGQVLPIEAFGLRENRPRSTCRGCDAKRFAANKARSTGAATFAPVAAPPADPINAEVERLAYQLATQARTVLDVLWDAAMEGADDLLPRLHDALCPHCPDDATDGAGRCLLRDLALLWENGGWEAVMGRPPPLRTHRGASTTH
jgi:hypothetical protein